MSVTDLHLQILDPFVQATITAVDKMGGLRAQPGEAFTDNVDGFAFKGYAVAAETTGQINGVILMHHYIETALQLGNRVTQSLLGTPSNEPAITDDLAEALAEWCNTAIGRATRELAISNLGIRFNPPYFIRDTATMKPLLDGVKEIISVPLHIDGMGRFYFNYLIKGYAAKQRPMISSQQKIMVVDDMRMVRTALRRHLGSLGYHNVVEASDGEEALRLHAAERPALIFMDVVMPNMTGNEALARLRAGGATTPVVMLSSVADQDLIRECEALGIAGYVIKPLTSDSGPEVLRTYLAHGDARQTDQAAVEATVEA